MDSFNEIHKYFKGKTIVMFLDYDGTLSPIVDNPDEAFMSEKVRHLFLLFLDALVESSSL
ncbi:Probable trehalose-phosphate phosphatase D [Linum perenne]